MDWVVNLRLEEDEDKDEAVVVAVLDWLIEACACSAQCFADLHVRCVSGVVLQSGLAGRWVYRCGETGYHL